MVNLEYYLIAALSYAIMFTYRYGYDIVAVVIDTLYLFDMDETDYLEGEYWQPEIYLAMTFLVAFMIFPVALIGITIFSPNRWTYIQYAAAEILAESYGFEKK